MGDRIECEQKEAEEEINCEKIGGGLEKGHRMNNDGVRFTLKGQTAGLATMACEGMWAFKDFQSFLL